MGSPAIVTLMDITEPRVRAILTGSCTPASDLKAAWNDLTEDECFQAVAYYGDAAGLNNHAETESNFCFEHNI